MRPWNLPSRHRVDPIGRQILVIRTGPHQIKIGGEVPGVEVEKIIVVVELETLVDPVEEEVVVVDTEEEEEEVALGL